MDYPQSAVCVSPALDGLGVFSLTARQPEDFIGPIEGTAIDDPTYESDYAMELGPHGALEPDPPFCYVNHSCEPNCALVECEVAGTDGQARWQLWLEVLRPIAPGDELTIDYGWPEKAAEPCHCGAAHCRGRIVAQR